MVFSNKWSWLCLTSVQGDAGWSSCTPGTVLWGTGTDQSPPASPVLESAALHSPGGSSASPGSLLVSPMRTEVHRDNAHWETHLVFAISSSTQLCKAFSALKWNVEVNWDEYNDSWQLYHNNPSTYTGTRKQSSPAVVCCFILPLTFFFFYAMISFKVICSYLQQCGCIIDCIWTKDILVCMFSWSGIWTTSCMESIRQKVMQKTSDRTGLILNQLCNIFIPINI